MPDLLSLTFDVAATVAAISLGLWGRAAERGYLLRSHFLTDMPLGPKLRRADLIAGVLTVFVLVGVWS